MWPFWTFIGLLATGTKAFAPAPIRWGGVSSQRFLVAPAPMASPSMAAVPPQKLTIRDPHGMSSPEVIPHFIAKPDSTIRWDEMGWCIEASGKKSGNAVRFNHCTGGPNQQWNWRPWGPMQLKGTNQCLGVMHEEGRLDGASIELRECEVEERESWKFENPIPLLTETPSRHSATSWALRHTLISFITMTMLGALGLSTWMWRRLPASKSDVGQTRVSLSEPLDLFQGANNKALAPSLNMQELRTVAAVMAQNPMPADEDDEMIPSDVDPSAELATSSSMEDPPFEASGPSVKLATGPSSMEEPPLKASQLHDESATPRDVSIESSRLDDYELDALIQGRLQMLLALGAGTRRGEAASLAEKENAQQAIEFLEQQMPVTEISDACLGTWELVMSNTQLFRSSPFFMASRAVCKDGAEADQYNLFCELHRASLTSISNIQRVRQVISPTQIVSEFEVTAGAVPFVGDLPFVNIKYSGGLPFAITGSIVSTADIVGTQGNAWRLLMDTVEIKGSNIPLVRQALDSGVSLSSRDLGNFLEENVAGYSIPRPEFRVTYLNDGFRVSRDQDTNWFVYVRASQSQIPKNYTDEPADLGIGKLVDGLQRIF